MRMMRIEQFATAEPGWKAVFKEPDGKESLSQIGRASCRERV